MVTAGVVLHSGFGYLPIRGEQPFQLFFSRLPVGTNSVAGTSKKGRRRTASKALPSPRQAGPTDPHPVSPSHFVTENGRQSEWVADRRSGMLRLMKGVGREDEGEARLCFQSFRPGR